VARSKTLSNKETHRDKRDKCMVTLQQTICMSGMKSTTQWCRTTILNTYHHVQQSSIWVSNNNFILGTHLQVRNENISLTNVACNHCVERVQKSLLNIANKGNKMKALRGVMENKQPITLECNRKK